MSDRIMSRPYFRATCCERCVFHQGEHAADCPNLAAEDVQDLRDAEAALAEALKFGTVSLSELRERLDA